MQRLLVTGGTGTLGRAIVRCLLTENHRVAVLSSRDRPEVPPGTDTVTGDLASPRSLQERLAGYDAVMHCAGNPRDSETIDVGGTANLLEALGRDGVRHFLYPSIVGVDQSDYPYYRDKLKAETLIRRSGIPYTIVRMTQFHDFILWIIGSLHTRSERVVSIPAGMAFQSIHTGDAAGYFADCLRTGPANDVRILGGPEVLPFARMVQTYFGASGKAHDLAEYVSDDPLHVLFASGINLAPRHAAGRVAWRDYINDYFSERHRG